MAKFTGVRSHGGGIEIRWQYNGQSYSRFLNQVANETNLQEAARQRKKFIELCRLGEYEEVTLLSLTFLDVAQEMLAYKALHNKQSTLDNMLSKLNSHWSTLFELQIDTISLSDIRKAERALSKLSPKTRKNSLSDLKQVFNYAISEQYITDNPCRTLQPPKVQKKRIDSFSREEKESILERLASKYHLFYLFMLDSGMRTGEVQGLQWIDIQGDYAHVERSIYRGQVTTTKTHQARQVLLSPRTLLALKEHQPYRFKSKWLFTPRNSELPYATDRALTQVFKRACEAAGVRYRRPYYCRHTYATLALKAGVSPIVVAKQIGDRLETMQRNYADVMAEDNDRRELEKALRSS